MSLPLFMRLEDSRKGHTEKWGCVLPALAWNKDDLLPAIAQQHDSGEVLMLAWVNEASLKESLATGRAVYWSRSRQCLWRKGESSGHVQALIEMRLDCDGDTVLMLVDQQGPACHTGRPNCFYHQLKAEGLTVLVNPPDSE